MGYNTATVLVDDSSCRQDSISTVVDNSTHTVVYQPTREILREYYPAHDDALPDLTSAPELIDTDDQTLSLNGMTLAIEG